MKSCRFICPMLLAMLFLVSACAAPLPGELAVDGSVPPSPSPGASMSAAPSLAATPLPTATPSAAPATTAPPTRSSAPTPTPRPTAAPTPEPVEETPSPEPDAAWLRPNEQPIFTSADIPEEWALGMTREESLALHEVPMRLGIYFDEDGSLMEVIHYYDDLFAAFTRWEKDGPLRLSRVTLTTDAFKGPRGVQVGSRMRDALRAFRVQPVELDEERQRKLLFQAYDGPLLYAVVYDVTMLWDTAYTVVERPLAYLEPLMNEEGESFWRALYLDAPLELEKSSAEQLRYGWSTCFYMEEKAGRLTEIGWYIAGDE